MADRISYVAGFEEPVSLDEAKVAARVDGDELNAFIATAITAAREAAEHITGRCYRRQVRREELADWPSTQAAIDVNGAVSCEVKYWTGADWSAALAAEAFAFAPGGIGGNGTVLAPAIGTAWPALPARAVGPRVRIDITAGPASPEAVPAQVKLYIQANVSAWVENPQAATSRALVVSPLFARLLDAATLWG